MSSLPLTCILILYSAYGAYLVFQLWSHAHLYSDDSPDNFKSRQYPSRNNSVEHLRHDNNNDSTEAHSTAVFGNGSTSAPRSNLAPEETLAVDPQNNDLEKQNKNHGEDDKDGEEPTMSAWMSIATLVVVSVVSAVQSN